MLSNNAGASDDPTPALPSTNEAPPAGSPLGQLELQDGPAEIVRCPTGLLDLPDELLAVIWEAVFAHRCPQIGHLLSEQAHHGSDPTIMVAHGDPGWRHIQHLVFRPENVLHPLRLALAAATQLESLTDVVISLAEESTSHPVCRYAEILASLPRLDRLCMMGAISGLHLRSLHILLYNDPDAASEDGSSLSDCFYQQLFPILKDLGLRDLAVSEATHAHWSFLAELEPLTTVTSLYYEALLDEGSDTDRWRGLARLLPLFPALKVLRLWLFDFCDLADLPPASNHPTLVAVLAFLKSTQVRALQLDGNDEQNIVRATRYIGEAEFKLERCRKEDGGQSVDESW
ncbi:RHTO0S27e01024g1_1 [Rhodotorula toruloides]|uniref:RHTO0S27e01024g1_1 n=1 Tax=Rhodotorula toruloides TaxID=5286 RepID=A0A061BJB4_RHOTO|nr:RHTO0S27e01024g1_1 [Rhodotorula toruloides]